MLIEGENGRYAGRPHDLKTGAINQAEGAPRGRKEGGHGKAMQVGGDKLDPKQREEVIVESPHGLHAKAVLQESKGLDKGIAARDEHVIGPDQVGPDLFCPLVIGVISVEQRIESGRVDEDLHLP
jgi:hypothetical protein